VTFPTRFSAGAALALAFSCSPALAQPSPAPDVQLGAYVQVQYDRITIEELTADRVFFRRLVASLQGNVTDDWSGEVEVDLALAVQGDRVIVKDAYLRYSGFRAQGLTLTVGNQKMPFSRSVLAPSSRRGLIERPFTGERPFGAVGRAIAVQVEGRHSAQRIQWAAALASALHAPDAFEIRIDGLADSRATWNEGVLSVGRFEWHPRGPTPRDQGNLTCGLPNGDCQLRVMAGVGAYIWQNDGDRNLNTTNGVGTSAVLADLDQARAVELSAGLRGHRFSVDAAWDRISGRTIDPAFSGGLYLDGSTVLYQAAVEAGYMVVPGRLEVLGAIDSLDISARTAVAYRPSFGLDWYLHQHRLKVSFMHRENFNVLGVAGARGRSTFVQAQIAF
jgi:phosphate-selective porin OprO and OprP